LKKRFPEMPFTFVWDNEATRKKVLFAEYKAQRSSVGIHSQISDLKDLLKGFAVRQAECPGEEADDVLATLARQYETEGTVYIYSSDKDLLQLVKDGKVIVVRPKVGQREEQFFDEAAVKQEFGVSPQNLSCYLTLRGDQVDNVPGLPRVKSSFIAELSEKYGLPRNVYAHLSEETLTDFQVQAFREFEQQSNLNWQIVQLVDDLPLVLSEGQTDSEHVQKFLDRYEIRKLSSSALTDLFGKESSFNSRVTQGITMPSLF